MKTILLIAFTVPCLVGVGCGGAGQSGEARAETHDHAHEAEVGSSSDLDLTAGELSAARCEHDMPTVDCLQCRFEVGVVEVADELLDPERGALRTARAGRGSGGFLELPGEVGLDQQRAVFLDAPAAGIVRAIHVDVGSRVRAGDALFELDAAEVGEAASALRRAAAALQAAEAAAARERELYERKVCPRRDLEAAESELAQAHAERDAASARLGALGIAAGEVGLIAAGEAQPAAAGRLRVRAPFDGEVLERSLALGARVAPGERALLLADTRSMWVTATVQERELAALLEARSRAAGAAEVALGAYPGRVFPATLGAVGGTLDPVTRSAHARLVVANQEGLLRAGMLARVRIPVASGTGAIWLPAEAVLDDAGREFVFVRLRDSLFHRRAVTTGRRAGQRVEIAGGLSEGDEVVTTGAFLLKSDVLRAKMGAGCAD